MQSQTDVTKFLGTLTDFYAVNARHGLPWRQPEADGTFDGYKILVSEIMLQQTQVSRVMPKYVELMTSFPDISSLANAKLSQVLQVWNGLGYNRRAKFLYESSKLIFARHRGVVPRSIDELVRLPGVGHNTAAAISVYTYNEPHLFIETNIRSVFIFHFFNERENVADTVILNKLTMVLKEVKEQKEFTYRDFYWAMMDYGTHLKQTHGNVNRRSRHYTKQSQFKGSLRQLRGEILRQLISGQKSTEELNTIIADIRLDQVLSGLEADKLIQHVETVWKLPD